MSAPTRIGVIDSHLRCRPCAGEDGTAAVLPIPPWLAALAQGLQERAHLHSVACVRLCGVLPWFDTGIQLQAGQQVTLFAGGGLVWNKPATAVAPYSGAAKEENVLQNFFKNIFGKRFEKSFLKRF